MLASTTLGRKPGARLHKPSPGPSPLGSRPPSPKGSSSRTGEAKGAQGWASESRQAELIGSLAEPLLSTRLHDYSHAEPHVPPGQRSKDSEATVHAETGYLMIPFCVIEHKKSHHSAQQAVNQIRLYSFSAASFFSALGVKEAIPIFGIVTYGSIATLFLTWSSVTQERQMPEAKFMFEQGTLSFDIAQPLDCYRFCTFLLRLRTLGDILQSKLRSQNYTDVFFKAIYDPSHPLRQWKMRENSASK
ncbi:hypothetical protein DXG01_004507 [Tephrocybe rancida]|nr:hypothetical protein DXG01_004507 [Tephrocybe rancida]